MRVSLNSHYLDSASPASRYRANNQLEIQFGLSEQKMKQVYIKDLTVLFLSLVGNTWQTNRQEACLWSRNFSPVHRPVFLLTLLVSAMVVCIPDISGRKSKSPSSSAPDPYPQSSPAHDYYKAQWRATDEQMRIWSNRNKEKRKTIHEIQIFEKNIKKPKHQEGKKRPRSTVKQI